MSVNSPTALGSTPFVVGGVSTANAILTVTVPADPAATTSGRQAVITSIAIRTINDSSSGVTASAILQPTLTNTQNAATGAATTLTYTFANGLAAWTDRVVIDEQYPWPGGLPIVEGSAGVLSVPACGAGILSEARVTGYYV